MPRAAWLAIGAAAAALALDSVAPVAVFLAGTSLVAAAVALAAARRPRGSMSVLALGFGVAVLGVRGGLAAPRAVADIPSGDGPWVGVVQSVGSVRAGSRPAVVELETQPAVLVAATLPWYPAVVPGDRVELRGRIRPPPVDDDYGAYLVRIGAVGSLRAESLTVLAASGSGASSLEGLRRLAADGLDRAMPEPEAGLAAGILIGLRDRVDRDLAAAFTTAGASHVVAISGWNIAIVAATLGALAGRSPRCCCSIPPGSMTPASGCRCSRRPASSRGARR
jgi:competence protein ComEC